MGQLGGRSFVDQIRIVETEMPGDVQQRRGAFLKNWQERYDLLSCPACGGIYATDNHTVTVAEGLVTLDPSFGCPGCGAHFYVRAGEVQMLDFEYSHSKS
jgi:hypothetical protein